MKTVEIEKSHWGAKVLLDECNGRKCCLGFACTALGYTDEQILRRGLPSEVGENAFREITSISLTKLFNETLTGAIKPISSSPPLERFLAAVNDYYHLYAYKGEKEAATELLELGFNEAGFEIKWV